MADIIANVEHVTKVFGDVVAVSDVSFSIEEGNIIGFLGPNGAGKTTSIEMLLGLIRPQTGRVSLFGVDPFYHEKVKYLVGYISEEGVFPRWMTALDLLTSMGEYYMDRAEAKERAYEVLEDVDLVEVAEKKIRQFSKGMKQRMKIAQALIHKPRLVISDEPFNGLDPLIRHNMFELIRTYNKKYGTTFFISSHILFEVEKLANQIILLYKGRTIAQGRPRRIREMIQDQPHTIQIRADDIKQVLKLLAEHADGEIIRSFEIGSQQNKRSLIVETIQPQQFYTMFTQLVVEHDLKVTEMRPTDEGLESLFNTLTQG